MSLRKLPKIDARRLPSVSAFELDDNALSRWNAGVQAREAESNTISVLDVIGEDFFGEGITARRVSAALRAIGDQEVVVDLNSPGGDFFEGVAIYNALRAHPHKVTVRVLGIAASAASIIAMAGDEIEIGKAGFLMVHNAWVIAMGNRHDMADAAATLEPFDDAMAGVYADRSGMDKARVAELMDNETWMNGEQAVAEGFADRFLAADAVKEDEDKRYKSQAQNTVRRLDTALAKAGLPRSERRTLLNEVKGGTQDAAVTVMHDADEITAADVQQLCRSLKLG